mmetsp:Transcript_32122/g.75528  ORF Transcript_32122/g.75528 Transcript_32122/m.75528 type:complete len:212 (+) Transcript_32122:67-702(+)
MRVPSSSSCSRIDAGEAFFSSVPSLLLLPKKSSTTANPFFSSDPRNSDSDKRSRICSLTNVNMFTLSRCALSNSFAFSAAASGFSTLIGSSFSSSLEKISKSGDGKSAYGFGPPLAFSRRRCSRSFIEGFFFFRFTAMSRLTPSLFRLPHAFTAAGGVCAKRGAASGEKAATIATDENSQHDSRSCCCTIFSAVGFEVSENDRRLELQRIS